MDVSVWLVVCLALAAVAGVCAYKCLVYATSLDRLIEQLRQVNEGERCALEVHARQRRVVEVTRLLNDGRERSLALLDAKDDELERLNDELAFFSHDIRTPVAVIQGYMELLQADGDEGNRRVYLGRIREKLAVMRTMIDELCDYALIVAGSEAPACKDVVVYDLLCSVLADHYGAFAAKGWEPCLEFDDEAYRVRCPETDLRRVLTNLVGNVVKYGTGAPHIALCGSTLHISNAVANPDGIDTARMFERFWRADPARAGRGNGLGLAVARVLCERMGVRIEAGLQAGVLDVTLNFPKQGQAVMHEAGQA